MSTKHWDEISRSRNSFSKIGALNLSSCSGAIGCAIYFRDRECVERARFCTPTMFFVYGDLSESWRMVPKVWERDPDRSEKEGPCSLEIGDEVPALIPLPVFVFVDFRPCWHQLALVLTFVDILLTTVNKYFTINRALSRLYNYLQIRYQIHLNHVVHTDNRDIPLD